jgi:ApbE superfamily uncharacterized protein (UPF0280 family)
MKHLLRRRPKAFEIHVQNLTMRISAPDDLAEESRAAALSFWEQIESYAIREPSFRSSKRPLGSVPVDAPAIVKEMAAVSSAAGVGPMFTFGGAVVDQVGRFLADQVADVTVACGGDHFVRSHRTVTVGVQRVGGEPFTVSVPASDAGVGVCTTVGRSRSSGGPDALAVIADSCMLADAAAAGVEALIGKPEGFGSALRYLREVPGVSGGVVVVGEQIGVAGPVELGG